MTSAILKKTTLTIGLLISGYVHAGYLTNFNDPSSGNLINAINQRNLHVVQLGDSHTAADVMTDAMRSQLQQALGDGGMGWGMPMYHSGQRMARYSYDNAGWQPISSRTERHHNYTLGGLLATPKYHGATLTIKSRQHEPVQRFVVSIRQSADDGVFTGVDARGQSFVLEAPIKNNTWQVVQFTAQPPFTITANNANRSAIGGWWGKNAQGTGAIVSPLGINGAQLSYWNRWGNWQQELRAISPSLVILAYGTNEAFDDNIDITATRQLLVQKIQEIRQSSPNSAVMILSAPESLKSTSGACGTRPAKLTAIQQMQYEVAQSQNTLLWHWQQAMGGSCSMKSWVSQGLAAKDGVHFTNRGYQNLGKSLADDILALRGGAYSSGVSSTTTTRSYVGSSQTHNQNQRQSNTGQTATRQNNPSQNSAGYTTPNPSYAPVPTTPAKPAGRGTICASDGTCRSF